MREEGRPNEEDGEGHVMEREGRGSRPGRGGRKARFLRCYHGNVMTILFHLLLSLLGNNPADAGVGEARVIVWCVSHLMRKEKWGSERWGKVMFTFKERCFRSLKKILYKV